MASKLKIKVNGLVHNVTASLDTPLLYVLHNELHLHGPRFGCGLAQCGACSVLLDGKEIRSCVTPVAAVSGKAITTLEGLPAAWAKSRGTTAVTPGTLHPLVCIHPDTGRPGLYLGRRRNAYIEGLSLDESEALLDEIWREATRDQLTWRHQWRVGDLVLWDNRCTMHRRDGFDPASRRVMHRTQIRN